MTELIWDGKYNKYGKKNAPVRIALSYYPDFVAKVAGAEFWIIETKGREDIEVAQRTTRRTCGVRMQPH